MTVFCFQFRNVTNSDRNGWGTHQRGWTWQVSILEIGSHYLVRSGVQYIRSWQQCTTLPIQPLKTGPLAEASPNVPLSLFLRTYATLCHVTWQSHCSAWVSNVPSWKYTLATVVRIGGQLQETSCPLAAHKEAVNCLFTWLHCTVL